MTLSSEALEHLADDLVAEHTQAVQCLIDLRIKRGLSQETVADRMVVPVSTVEQFEHYDRNPTLSMIRRYALAVGASMTITVEEYHGRHDQ